MENIVAAQNPWKRGLPALSQKIIKRKIIPVIEPWLDEEEIVVVKGSRQAGKTTILYCLIDDLLKRGIDPKNIFYFLLDNLRLQQQFTENPYALKELIESYIGEPLEKYPDKIYIFLDEIQKLNKFTNVIKEYFDLFKNIKFVLSGSSVLQLAASISESLRGRTISFLVTPLTTGEMIPQVETIAFDDLLDFTILNSHHSRLLPHKSEIELRNNQQFVFGSMPQIFLSKDETQKQIRLGEYLETFIRKDTIETLQVAKYLDFEKLLRLLSYQIGSVVNVSELSQQTQLGHQVMRKYLMLGEESFIIQFLAPFFSNKRKSLVKDRKIYFEDLGIRNNLSGKDSPALLRDPNLGAEAENFVNITLNKYFAIRKMKMTKNFFRSYQGLEVDFIVEVEGKTVPIEVKFQNQIKKKDFSHLLLFMKDLNLTEGLIITKDSFGIEKFGEQQVLLLPLWLFSVII